MSPKSTFAPLSNLLRESDVLLLLGPRIRQRFGEAGDREIRWGGAINNTTDFMSLLGRESVHAGLVCLNVAPRLMSLDVQRRLFALVLDRLGDIELINELLEVTLMEDRSVRVERYNLPPAK